MTSRPDRLLRLILGWTAVTLLFVWLPLIRGAMDGASYQWGASYFGLSIRGAGLGGDYWVLLLQGALGLAVLALGWRGSRPTFHVLALLWHGLFATSAVYSALKDPNQYRFRGDTMGIDISLAWVGPLFFGGFFLLTLLWVVRDLRRAGRTPAVPWSSVNTRWLGALILLLPVQFFLLRFGAPHGLTDKVGVVLTILQCLLLGRIFRPAWRRNPRTMLTPQFTR